MKFSNTHMDLEEDLENGAMVEGEVESTLCLEITWLTINSYN
jgi:hypothetical protein